MVGILRSLGIEGERLGDALDDAAWAAKMAEDTEQAVRLAEEKWRYPRRPRSHMFDGWLSREMDLAHWRLHAGSPEVDADQVIGAMEAILEDVDRSDQALFAAHLRYTISRSKESTAVATVASDMSAMRCAATATSDIADRCRSASWGSEPGSWSSVDRTEPSGSRLPRVGGRKRWVARSSRSTTGPASPTRMSRRPHSFRPTRSHEDCGRVRRCRSKRRSPYALHELPEDAGGKEPHRGRHDLTPREHEVLALVADGRTDGEIAEALVISKKTASVHVASIKAKLGAGSRAKSCPWPCAVGSSARLDLGARARSLTRFP